MLKAFNDNSRAVHDAEAIVVLCVLVGSPAGWGEVCRRLNLVLFSHVHRRLSRDMS